MNIERYFLSITSAATATSCLLGADGFFSVMVSVFKTSLLFTLCLEVWACSASTTPSRRGKVFTVSEISKALRNAECLNQKQE